MTNSTSLIAIYGKLFYFIYFIVSSTIYGRGVSSFLYFRKYIIFNIIVYKPIKKNKKIHFS